MITAPGPGGFSCPPLLQQAVCPPCLPRPSPSSGHRSPDSSRETKRLPLTLALSDEVGRGIATVYVGPWSECQPKQQTFKRERRDTRTRESTSLRENRPRSLPVPQPASPHFPLPWLPASSPSPSGPSSPPPQLGERQRNVVCRSVPEYQRRTSFTILTCRTSSGATTPFKECMDGSRATVVPADRGSCVVPRDCQVASWTSWSPAFPQPCAAGASFVITLPWQAYNSNNLFRLAMQSDISSHFPSSASVPSTLNI